MLLKDHIKKQKIDAPIQEDQPNIAEPYLVINENLFKKKERYRRKAKQNALKTKRLITRARKSRAKLKRKAGDRLDDLLDNPDAETIPYTEPYRNTFTKKDEIYRRNAKKKALKILRNKRKRVDPSSDAETIPYVEPYKDKTSKRDNLYKKKPKKRTENNKSSTKSKV